MCISSLVESSHSLAEFASHPQLSNIYFSGSSWATDDDDI